LDPGPLPLKGEDNRAVPVFPSAPWTIPTGYCTSVFSKTLGPGIRLGYIVADWEVMCRLLIPKTDAGTGVMDQMIVADYFTNHYEEHILNVRAGLRRKCCRPGWGREYGDCSRAG